MKEVRVDYTLQTIPPVTKIIGWPAWDAPLGASFYLANDRVADSLRWYVVCTADVTRFEYIADNTPTTS